jgi:transposase
MVRRGELTDEGWGRVAPLLPESGQPAERRRCHREVVNGILWKLRLARLQYGLLSAAAW